MYLDWPALVGIGTVAVMLWWLHMGTKVKLIKAEARIDELERALRERGAG